MVGENSPLDPFYRKDGWDDDLGQKVYFVEFGQDGSASSHNGKSCAAPGKDSFTNVHPNHGALIDKAQVMSFPEGLSGLSFLNEDGDIVGNEKNCGGEYQDELKVLSDVDGGFRTFSVLAYYYDYQSGSQRTSFEAIGYDYNLMQFTP